MITESKITLDHVAAEVAKLSARAADHEGGQTSREIRDALGLSENATGRFLQAAISNGFMTCGRGRRTTISGVVTLVPVYSPVVNSSTMAARKTKAKKNG